MTAPIAGATASNYVPVAADVGNTLTVSVVATNTGGSSTPATSAATSAVIAAIGVPMLMTASITFLADGGYNNGPINASTNVVLTAPAGLAIGDLMLAFVSIAAKSNTGTFTPPSGWTLAAITTRQQNSTTTYFIQTACYYKIAVSGEPANYTFTLSGSPTSPNIDGNIRAYRGTSTATPPINASAVNSTSSVVTSVIVPAISETFINGEWAVYCGTNDRNFGYSSSSPTALGNTFYSAGVGVAYEIGDFIPSSAPAAETLTWAGGGILAGIGVTSGPNTGLPAISGIAQVGQTLTASSGNWTNSPTSFTYQWNRAGTAISGATASTYVSVTADVGNTLTVSVVATNGTGSSTPAVSAATAAIIAASSGVVISGTAQVGQTLTASGGAAYQWYLEGSAISGATASTYVVQPGDIGGLIQAASGGVFSALGTPVIGTTVFYVSQSTGNDSNAGTLAAPWKTIAKVNSQSFSPGTSVLFKRGDTWRITDAAGDDVQLSPATSGSAGNPIVFDAYGAGATPIFHGAADASLTSNWTNIGTNLWQSVQTFPPIGGNSNGHPFNNANDIGNIVWGLSPLGGSSPATALDGTAGTMALYGSNLSNLTAQGQWWFNTTNFTVQVFSVGNPATTMPGIQLVVDKSLIITGNSHLVFQNITVQFAAGGITYFFNPNDVTLRDMVIQWIGGGNLGGGGTSDSRYGDGYDTGGPTNDAMIDRCFFYQGYDGFVVPQNWGANNTNITVRNCILYKWSAAAIGILNISGAAATVNNMNFYNNTLYSTDGWSVGQRPNGNQQFGINIFTGTAITYNNFALQNNAIAGLRPLALIVSRAMGQNLNGFNNAIIDYNSWMPVPGGVLYFALDNNGGNYDLQTWASGHGRETHGLIGVDPQFTSQSTSNFVPSASSPLRNAGANLSGAGVVWDFNKKPRPASGPFTIGALDTPVTIPPPSGVMFLADGGYKNSSPINAGSTVALNAPAGLAAGDLMLAFVSIAAKSNTGTFTPPSGWTLITITTQRQNSTTSYFIQTACYYKIAGSGEPATYTFNLSGSPTSPNIDGNIRAYRGTAASPINSFASNSTSTILSSVIVPAIPETFASGEWAVYCGTNDGNLGYSSSSPKTIAHAFYSAGVGVAYEIGDFIPSSAPAAETLTWAGAGILAGIGVTILHG